MSYNIATLEVYDEAMGSVANNFFLQSFAKETFIPATKVKTDIIRNGEPLAVDVVRGGDDDNFNSVERYTTKEYMPPLYNEKTRITADQLLQITPGMNVYDPISKDRNLMYLATKSQIYNTFKIRRSVEKQFAEMLQEGTITVENGESLDF